MDEIERQIGGLSSQLDRSSAELILAEDNLAERRAVLERRLVDIYKRGPLYTFQALLAAESFGDLLQPLQVPLPHQPAGPGAGDRRRAAPEPGGRRAEQHPRRAAASSTGSRQEREAEFAKFTELAQARARRLEALQRSARSTERRLTTLQKDEARLNGLLAALERARRDDAAAAALRGAVAGAGLDHHGDLGKLDWPVEGTIVYRFGRDTLPSGGIIRWNGVGIAARGRARRCTRWRRERCGWWDSSGPTASRSCWSTATATTRSTPTSSRPTVKLGATVSKGQTVGTVGGENSDYGPHLHFEIRGENQIALDPTAWLRKR